MKSAEKSMLTPRQWSFLLGGLIRPVLMKSGIL